MNTTRCEPGEVPRGTVSFDRMFPLTSALTVPSRVGVLHINSVTALFGAKPPPDTATAWPGAALEGVATPADVVAADPQPELDPLAELDPLVPPPGALAPPPGEVAPEAVKWMTT